MLEVRNNENELKSLSEAEPDRTSETESDSSRSNSPLPPPTISNDALVSLFYFLKYSSKCSLKTISFFYNIEV